MLSALMAVPTAALAAAALDVTIANAQQTVAGANAASPEGKIIIERVDGHILMVGIESGSSENRITVSMFEAIGRAYNELETDPGLRVAVLWAKNADFCGGLHLQDWGNRLATGPLSFNGNFINPVGTVGNLRTKPVIVAAQGLTAMLGNELFLAADIRVAANNARFHQGEAARALYPAGGGTIRLVEEIGWGRAMRYMMTGDEWTADEALAMGLAQFVTPVGQQVDKAVEVARKVAACAPLGIQSILKSQHVLRRQGLQAAYDSLLPQFGALFRTQDFRERQVAYRENRAPNYVGR
jgi:enoyl-CoA hydratase/carnithine racemase